jgi:ABC-type transport system involved in cytochrome c biogenesis permease subunit
MADGSIASLAAGACFLLAVLACAQRRWIGTWLGAAGAAILAGALAARGLRAGRWPLTDQYEFALAFALGTALMALVLGVRPGGEQAGQDKNPAEGAVAIQATAMAVAAALVAYARLGLPASKRGIQPLPPALDAVWLPLHVGTAALAYGALTVAGAAAFVYLLRESARTEAARSLDRAIATGYPLLSLSMLLGMVWAQVAWGRYWGWDVKEVWTLITWLVYTLYWHLRGRSRLKGRRLAWLALAGLGAVFFTFLGVGWLARAVGLQSLHLF